MTHLAEPAVAWHSSTASGAPLNVLLLDRDSNKIEFIDFADHLSKHFAFASICVPINEGGGCA